MSRFLRDSSAKACGVTLMLLSVLLALLAGCGGGGNSSGGSDPGLKLETVATGLTVPWSIVFAPDGRIFVTERAGRVRVIQNNQLQADPFFTVPDVEPTGESGLMGMCLHPQFSSNHFAYLAYASQADGIKVVRYEVTSSSFTDPQTIIEDIPGSNLHCGCRIKFGPDGKLYITTGDAANGDIAQELDSLGGKTLRLNGDGSVPADNPFVGQSGARPEIWSYGHRNSQGLDWQPGTGDLWETEHGPSGFDGPGGGDEINLVEKGKNYGWNVVSHDETHVGMESPLRQYTPAQAPSGATFYNGAMFPQYDGNFFFACLKGQGIMRLGISGGQIVSQEKLFANLGRCRDVVQAPDGSIYFCTSNRDGRGSPAATDDRILRIVPSG